MTWNFFTPQKKPTAELVRYGIRSSGGKAHRIEISIGKAVAEQMGWAPKQRFDMAAGDGEHLGKLLIVRHDEGQFSILLSNRSAGTLLLQSTKQVKPLVITGKHPGEPVDWTVATPQDGIIITLPDWAFEGERGAPECILEKGIAEVKSVARETGPGSAPAKALPVAGTEPLAQAASVTPAPESGSNPQSSAAPGTEAQARPVPDPKSGTWSRDDLFELVRLKDAGKTYAQIGAALGRTGMACNVRYNKLVNDHHVGLFRAKQPVLQKSPERLAVVAPRDWPAEELRELVKLTDEKREDWAAVAALLNKPVNAVAAKFNELKTSGRLSAIRAALNRSARPQSPASAEQQKRPLSIAERDDKIITARTAGHSFQAIAEMLGEESAHAIETRWDVLTERAQKVAESPVAPSIESRAPQIARPPRAPTTADAIIRFKKNGIGVVGSSGKWFIGLDAVPVSDEGLIRRALELGQAAAE